MSKMKKYTLNFILLVALMLCNCANDNEEVIIQTATQEMNERNNQNPSDKVTDKMNVTIDGATKSVTLVDNAATRQLVAKLQEASVSVTLNSSGGFEIWGALGFSLPTSNEQVTAQPGDVVLYNGSNICLFYGSNSWSYTRLGHIDGLSDGELKTFLKAGESHINVILSLTEK